MEITIENGTAGALSARGIAVIIDVFRAFTVECVAFAGGIRQLYAVGEVDTARKLAQEMPGALLVGERNGIMCPGFSCGNSPSSLLQLPLRGRTMIHTTSAGTQGIALASHAQEILPGCLCNAKAIAEYIRAKAPERVSLVPMGWNGTEQAEEDCLCADVIHAYLQGETPDISKQLANLAYTAGAKFFDPAQQAVFPQGDFPLCTALNAYSFVLRACPQGAAFKVECIDR